MKKSKPKKRASVSSNPERLHGLSPRYPSTTGYTASSYAADRERVEEIERGIRTAWDVNAIGRRAMLDIPWLLAKLREAWAERDLAMVQVNMTASYIEQMRAELREAREEAELLKLAKADRAEG